MFSHPSVWDTHPSAPSGTTLQQTCMIYGRTIGVLSHKGKLVIGELRREDVRKKGTLAISDEYDSALDL